GFPLDTLNTGIRPHQPSVTSSLPAPYGFTADDTLVVIVDQEFATGTFSIPLEFKSQVSTSISNTSFTDTALINALDDAVGMYAVAISGDNTLTADASTITLVSGDTWRITLDSIPVTLTDYAVGDHV